MIDPEKWEKASDEEKLNAIEAVKKVMKEDALTKADNAIITSYLFGKVKGE